MSTKSIGYSSVKGRGGKFIVPNITVKNGQITNIEKSDLPQIQYANGVSDYTEELEEDTAQYEADLSLLNIDQGNLTTEISEYDKLQALVDALESNVESLNTDVSRETPAQVLLNYSYNSTPYGLTLPLNGAPWIRAGPIDYSFAAPVLGDYIRSILYDYPVAATGTYHLRVSLALTQQRAGSINVNGTSYSARAMPGAGQQVSFVYIYLDGVLQSVSQSCNWDYYSTQIYINASRFLQINSGQKLSVGVWFVADVSDSLDIPSKEIGFFWNLNASTDYVAPAGALLNSSAYGSSCLKLTFINGV
jgi:hypothetical protein